MDHQTYLNDTVLALLNPDTDGIAERILAEPQHFLNFLQSARHTDLVLDGDKRKFFYGSSLEKIAAKGKQVSSPCHPSAMEGVDMELARERLADPSMVHLLHCVVGQYGEAAEMLIALCDYIFYGADFDSKNALEEAGDDMFFGSGKLHFLGFSPEQVRIANTGKLHGGRYKDGKFSEEATSDRDYAKEEEAAAAALNDENNTQQDHEWYIVSRISDTRPDADAMLVCLSSVPFPPGHITHEKTKPYAFVALNNTSDDPDSPLAWVALTEEQKRDLGELMERENVAAGAWVWVGMRAVDEVDPLCVRKEEHEKLAATLDTPAR